MVASISPKLRPAIPRFQDQCPWCEQPISHDRFDEITARIGQSEKSRSIALEAKLKEEFDDERQRIALDARNAVTAAERDASKRAAAGVRRIEEQAAAHLAEVVATHRSEMVALAARAEEMAATRLRIGLTEADARIRTAEAARSEAERVASERIEDGERQRAELQRRLHDLGQAHRAEIIERTNEVREGMSREMSKSLLDVKAVAFAEKQRLNEIVDDLKRRLEQRTAADLGEGAEIDLFEALRVAFPHDTIHRVPKGENGADVVHDVVETGAIRGRIVYDSKNRNAWQGNFVTKLHADMLAANADHAILSTNRFPAGTRQLLVTDGVIVASPARVVALVELLRAHILQLDAMRASTEQREEKTAAVYDYIVSERFNRLMEALQGSVGRFAAIEADERKAHKAVWSKREKILKEMDRTRGTIAHELQRIVGGAC